MKQLNWLKKEIDDFFSTKYKIEQCNNYYFVFVKSWWDPFWFPYSFSTDELQKAYDFIEFMKRKPIVIDIVK